jgi:DNA-binding NarL/FixJ family response regulator
LQAIEKLTRREKEILWALAEGLESREIAEKMNITVETERTHMVNILHKIGVHSRLQALVFAARHGLVEIR